MGGLRGTAFALCVVAGLCGAPPASAQDGDVDSDWDAVFMMVPPEAPSDSGQASGKSSAAGKAPGKQPLSTSGYSRLRDSWHVTVEDSAWQTSAEGGLPPLVMRGLGHEEPVVLQPQGDLGGFDEAEVALASQLMGTWEGGPSTRPRLLDLIYQAMRHFDVHSVTLVSGIRHDRSGSRHSHGLAADIVLPGINDEKLCAFFRDKGFVGVGFYPKAGFVHIDVRERSYFWVDRSAPGSRRSRMHQVRAEEAKEADDAALARGQQPTVNPERLQKALEKRSVRRSKQHGKRGKQREPRSKRADTKPSKSDDGASGAHAPIAAPSPAASVGATSATAKADKAAPQEGKQASPAQASSAEGRTPKRASTAEKKPRARDAGKRAPAAAEGPPAKQPKP